MYMKQRSLSTNTALCFTDVISLCERRVVKSHNISWDIDAIALFQEFTNYMHNYDKLLLTVKHIIISSCESPYFKANTLFLYEK